MTGRQEGRRTGGLHAMKGKVEEVSASVSVCISTSEGGSSVS